MDIKAWLVELNLECYIESFTENLIDEEILLELTSDELKNDLGVKPLGHRKLILIAIEKLKNIAISTEQNEQPSFLEKLPSVIALPLAEFKQETDPVLKLWNACDTIELLLRLIVITGLADLNNSGGIPSKVLSEMRPRIEEPTLGKWKGMAIAVAKALRPDITIIPEVRALVLDQIIPLLDGESKQPSIDSSFSVVRNQLAHGGGVTKAAARRLLVTWLPKLDTLFDSIVPLLSDLKLIVRSDVDKFGILRGPSLAPVDSETLAENLQTSLNSAFQRGDEVLLVRNKIVVTLWPFSQYNQPQVAGANTPPTRLSVAQIYARRGKVGLQLTPVGSEEVCQSESDEPAKDAFMRFFRFEEERLKKQESGFTVRGFDRDFQRDAANLIGRQKELNKINQIISNITEGVFWISGTAGIGKSFLMARVVSDLLLETPEDMLVLAYRFKSGDARCSREQFLTFANERLEVWTEIEHGIQHTKIQQGKEKKKKKFRPQKPLDHLKSLLNGIGNRRVLFILDGLDEISEQDREFAVNVPLDIVFPGVSWLCAGRPERGLAKAFDPSSCIHIFPEGVPPMDAGDIRSMFLEKIGPLRKRLLRNDRDDEDQVTNVFLDRVTKNAHGLPIYVTYVIGDVLSGRYRALDAGELLPPSLDSYHQELLQRCAIGSLHQVITPLATTIATAHEALDAEALTSILIRRTVVPPGRKGSDLVLSGLSAIAAMLRRVTTPLGTDGFTLFHHSLRQHMHSNEAVVDAMDLSRTSLKQVCRDWQLLEEPLRGYAIRNLGIHYLDDGDAIGIAEQVSASEETQVLLTGIEKVMRVRLSQCNELKEESVVIQTMRLLADIPSIPVSNMLVDLFDHGFMSVGGWFNRFCVENLQPVIERATIDRRMLGWIRSIGTFDTMGAAAGGRGEQMAEIAMNLAEKYPEEPLSAFVVVVVASKRPLFEAVKLCEKACKMAAITGDPVAIWESEANRFRYNFDLWHLAEARQAALKTIAALPLTDRSFRTFLAQDNLAKVSMRSGDFLIAAKALAISSTAPKIVGEVPRAYSRGYLGTLLGYLGKKEEAIRLLEQVTPIVSEAHGRAGLFFSSPWLEFAMETDDYNSAARAAAKVESDVDAKKDMGWWSQEVLDFQLLARYYLKLGDFSTSRTWLVAAEAVNKREPHEGYTIGTLQVKAELDLQLNQYQEAITLAEQAYLLADRLGVGSKTPLLADLLAKIHQSANNLNEMKKWQNIAEKKRERWQIAKALKVIKDRVSV